MSGGKRFLAHHVNDGRSSSIHKIGAGAWTSVMNAAPKRVSGLVYQHKATGETWRCVMQTGTKRLLRRDSDQVANWLTAAQLAAHFVLISRPQHIECSCLSCRCPYRVESEGDVCRKCHANYHNGRPNKKENDDAR